MTLTLNANWLERAQRDGYEEVFLVSITKGATTWDFTDQRTTQFSYPVAVHSVTPLAARMDVKTRRLEVDGMTVVIDDDAIRDVIVANRLRGAKLRVRHGFVDLALADFIDYWTGAIEAAFPEPSDEAKQGVVRFECLSMLEVLRQMATMGRWIQKHPLDVVYDILSVKMALPAALIDGTDTGGSTYDPDAAAYSAISHIVVTRAPFADYYIDHTVRDPTPALDLIDELAMLLNGSLYVNEEGELSFAVFDSTAASVETWDEDTIDELKQLSLDDDLFNRVEFQFMAASDNTMQNLQTAGLGAPQQGRWRGSHVVNDTDSQTNHAYPGMTSRIVTHKTSSPWIGEGGVAARISELDLDRNTSVSSTATSFVLVGALAATFAGTRESQDGSGSQPANAKISAARPLYLLTEFGEIIKATSLTVHAASVSVNVTYSNDVGGTTTHGPYHKLWSVSGVTRAMFGTTAQSFTRVVDVTVQQYVADQLLQRFGNGIAKIEVATGLDQWDKEIGDFISLEWPAYLGYARDGMTAAAGKWEIVMKEHVPEDNKIRWVLAWAGVNTPTYSHSSRVDPWGANVHALAKDGVEDDEVVQKHKSSGLTVSHTSGLIGSLSSGFASAGVIRSENPAATEITFRADSDNYVFWDLEASTAGVVAVSRGTSAPSASPMEILLAVVATHATSVFGIDNVTNVPTKAMNGSKLVSESVAATQLAPSAVTESKLAASAVTASAIAPAAITTPAVADATLGSVHIVQNERKTGMRYNAQFSTAKKG